MADTVRCLKPGSSIYIAEFAFVSEPEKVDFYGKRWVDVYRDEEQITGEFGSFTVRKPDNTTHFIAHHFAPFELADMLQKNGVDVVEDRIVQARSALSGNISPNVNIWGTKR